MAKLFALGANAKKIMRKLLKDLLYWGRKLMLVSIFSLSYFSFFFLFFNVILFISLFCSFYIEVSKYTFSRVVDVCVWVRSGEQAALWIYVYLSEVFILRFKDVWWSLNTFYFRGQWKANQTVDRCSQVLYKILVLKKEISGPLGCSFIKNETPALMCPC